MDRMESKNFSRKSSDTDAIIAKPIPSRKKPACKSWGNAIVYRPRTAKIPPAMNVSSFVVMFVRS